jgi:uncharacterized protein (TIGR02118 family)
MAYRKLTFPWKRLPHLTREEAQRYWREQHGPLVAKYAGTMGIVRYVQTHTHLDAEGYGGRHSRGAPEPFDGLAELWFDPSAATGTPEERAAAARELLEDERNFLDHSRSPLWMGEEHVIVGSPAA